MTYGFVTEFEFHVPEATDSWRKGQEQELEKTGPGGLWCDIVHRTIVRCASDDCWFVMRIETFGAHVAVQDLHRMRVEGMRAALTGRTMRPALQIYSGPYPAGEHSQ